MRKGHLSLLFFVVISIAKMVFASTTLANEITRDLFENHNDAVFQVRVIDIASGDKFSIGSGFLINTSGGLATNFHVIAAYLHDPDKYRLEVIDYNSIVKAVELKNIDVTHDLALLQLNEQQAGAAQPFEFDLMPLTKGEKIFSMGNPHDLGMTIIEGIYNGLVQHVRHDNILFSGSLNPGMSGGPAFDSSGRVVGINVAKGQEQISFLVPAKHLVALLSKAKTGENKNFKQAISRQLYDDQDVFYRTVLETPDELQMLGEVNLPAALSDKINCWGHSEDKKEKNYATAHRHCQTEDRIFVKNNLYLGYFGYDFEWNTTEELSSIQFYNATSDRFTHARIFGGDKDDVSKPECVTKRINLLDKHWKASTCVRAYKKLSELFDVSFIMNSLSHKNKSLLVKIQMSGVSLINALAVQKHVMESIEWVESE